MVFLPQICLLPLTKETLRNLIAKTIDKMATGSIIFFHPPLPFVFNVVANYILVTLSVEIQHLKPFSITFVMGWR